MTINHKQKELIDYLFNNTKEKFPEIQFHNLSFGPDDTEHIWINISAEMDDDREEEFCSFAAELEADIHIDFGYRISLMLENLNPIGV